MIAGDLLLRRLTYLRQVYFVGSNEEAARLTGIPTARVKTFAFMLTGLLAAAGRRDRHQPGQRHRRQRRAWARSCG